MLQVGKDAFGPTNINSLKACGVMTDYIDVSEKEKTGCATITVTKDGYNSRLLVLLASS
ncbi:unnamed protein product [Gongylonema pulchrum]|uniref:Carbohydrate kinase PfkB domain-containing protein n=1 Tax=Gongylonema pulchrum TaxID=637853 RepID=A0A3P6TCU2_9BILA|nr:unnamed protein product [Gongylonema pulchrum]